MERFTASALTLYGEYGGTSVVLELLEISQLA
jgi:hypothetical protein